MRALIRSLAFALASILASGAARADDAETARRCIGEHEKSQALRRDGKLREAKATLLACASPACPELVRADCGIWVAEVEASVPTLVVSARDTSTGLDVVDARVEIDGAPTANRLDGKALGVDPGPHVIRVVRAGSPPLERRLVMAEGEHNRQVMFSFGAAAPEPAPPGPSRTLPFVLGGVGAVGLGSFAVFGITGRARYDGDLDGCAKHGCSAGEIDGVRARLIAADVSLGVAVVSLGLATYFWLSTPSAKARAATTPAPGFRF